MAQVIFQVNTHVVVAKVIVHCVTRRDCVHLVALVTRNFLSTILLREVYLVVAHG